MSELKVKATKGFAWNAIAQFSRQIVQTGTSIVLARLLAPEDFGLVGMAAIFTGFVAIINQFGLTSAIIQRKKITREHLDSAFWANITQGFLLFLIVVVLSPLAANFFGRAIIRPIIIVSSIQFVIDSFVIVQRSVLTRRLEFKKFSLPLIAGSIGAAAVSVPMAFLGFGIWSIVAGSLGSSAVELVGYNLVFRWRPRLSFKWNRFRELLSFGVQYMLNSVSNYANSNLDYFFIGKILGPTPLGYYSLAYRLIKFPQEKLGNLITRVTFPAFARIQDDNQRLSRGYLTAFGSINFITFPMLAGLAVAAPEFIRVVYSTKWEPAIVPLQLLCFAGLMMQLASNTGSVVLAKGRVDIPLKLSIIRAALLALILYFFTGYGLVVVAIIIDGFFLIYNLVFILIANKMIGLSLKSYFKTLSPILYSSILMVSTLLITRMLLVTKVHEAILLIIMVLSGIIIYFVSFWFIDKKFIIQIWKLIKIILPRKSKRINNA